MLKLIGQILNGGPWRLAKKLYDVEKDKTARVDGSALGAMLALELKDVAPVDVGEDTVVKIEYRVTFSTFGKSLLPEGDLKISVEAP